MENNNKIIKNNTNYQYFIGEYFEQTEDAQTSKITTSFVKLRYNLCAQWVSMIVLVGSRGISQACNIEALQLVRLRCPDKSEVRKSMTDKHVLRYCKTCHVSCSPNHLRYIMNSKNTHQR